MQIILYAALVLSLISISACSDSGTSPTPATKKQFVPLAAGNEWIYRSSYLDTAGISVKFDTVRVTEKKVINGEDWFLIDGFVMYTNRSDGYYFWYDGAVTPPQIVVKYPAKDSDEFIVSTYRDSDSGDSISFGARIIATDISVTVPAGSFSCYKYQYFIRNLNKNTTKYLEDFDCYAPGTGLVKTESENGTPYMNRRELMSYTLK